jgi:hypothetical protein
MTPEELANLAHLRAGTEKWPEPWRPSPGVSVVLTNYLNGSPADQPAAS